MLRNRQGIPGLSGVSSRACEGRNARCRALPDYAGPDMEIVALYPHRRQLGAKVRLFLDLLSHRFAQEQGRLDAVSEREGPE